MFIIRSKGLCWLASRPNDALNWPQAGGLLRAESVGAWWAAILEPERHPAFQENRDAILARWSPQFQDRLHELAFIGQDMPEAQLRAELERCLCTENELLFWQRGGTYPKAWPSL